MQKSDIKVLIIEDDETLGKAIFETLTRSGFTADLCQHADQAAANLRINEYKAAVIDCMIPGKNGLELAEDLKNEYPEMIIYLTSGIFKDKHYIQDALKKTLAKKFLVKPFNIEQELIEDIEDSFSEQVDIPKSPLHRMLSTGNISNNDILHAIKNTESTNAYDLPQIYALFTNSTISGKLTINYQDLDKPCEIQFKEGQITSLIYPDSKSFFGVLLIENGFISPEDLEKGLSVDNGLKIGEKLVNIHSLSPHAIDLVNMEQMKIRLSKTVRDTSVTLSFDEHTDNNKNSSIPKYELNLALSDIILSKISYDWITSFYQVWQDHTIEKGINHSNLSLLTSLPILSQVPELFEKIDYPHTLEEVTSSFPLQEHETLCALHFLITQRIFTISHNANTHIQTSSESKLNRFKKILSNMQNKNHFEVLGLSLDARPSEISRAYYELAKALHPDKISNDEPNELKALAHDIFSKINLAFQTLKEHNTRTNYLNELKVGKTEDILRLEEQFEIAHELLMKKKYQEAKNKFHQILSEKGHRQDTVIYYTWAAIKAGPKPNENHTEFLKSVKKKLDMVPPEDRHGSDYFFAKGLYYKMAEIRQKAAHCFRQSLTLNPNFIDARRELARLKQEHKDKHSSSVHITENTILGKIFGKKSS